MINKPNIQNLHLLQMFRGSAKEARNYPLGDDDIRNLLGSDIKIMTYDQLKGVKDWRKMFDAKGRCIMLYLTTGLTNGHWICMLNKPDHIEFFDPYGNKPDDIEEYTDPEVAEEAGITRHLLLPLLKQSKKPVYYNTYPFQKSNGDISTCGRHSVVRCLYAPKSLDQYKAIVDKSKLAPDDFVLGITYDKIGK
jgi:hypothetical protein